LDIIGDCSTDYACGEAAINGNFKCYLNNCGDYLAVQYIQFSTSISNKSTSTEVNKSLSMNHSSTNNDSESPAAG